jgi:hypothetical protein
MEAEINLDKAKEREIILLRYGACHCFFMKSTKKMSLTTTVFWLDKLYSISSVRELLMLTSNLIEVKVIYFHCPQSQYS